MLAGDWAEKSFLDPTGGDGAFLIALANEYRYQYGVDSLSDFAKRLFYIEVDESLVEKFKCRFHATFGIEFPESNIANIDFLLEPYPFDKVDAVIGNPPWANFTALPEGYKESVKGLFDKYGLNPDRKRLLLGSSRVDIAALVIVRALVETLKDSGRFAFYAPLSLFLGDGAHEGFRRYASLGRSFCISGIHDFEGKDIFDGISTRYGAFWGRVGTGNQFPIPYYIPDGENWTKHVAFPMTSPNSQLRIYKSSEEFHTRQAASFELKLTPSQRPRQGVNTCGSNSVFIFESRPPFIPDEYLYPLVGRPGNGQNTLPQRHIFIPHSRDGKPLHEKELRNHSQLWEYLLFHKEALSNRKGVLIQNWIGKGYWWALLGVGPYSFSPFKVLWKSLGAKTFEPEIFTTVEGQAWQGNQALHAYIPCNSMAEAKAVREKLLSPQIIECLGSLRMDGSRNWAQPGKISKLFTFEEESTFFS